MRRMAWILHLKFRLLTGCCAAAVTVGCSLLLLFVQDMDIKQVLSSLLFSVMSIAMNYFGNVKQGASIGERAAAGGLSAFF
jgi:hypothetical protein